MIGKGMHERKATTLVFATIRKYHCRLEKDQEQ